MINAPDVAREREEAAAEAARRGGGSGQKGGGEEERKQLQPTQQRREVGVSQQPSLQTLKGEAAQAITSGGAVAATAPDSPPASTQLHSSPSEMQRAMQATLASGGRREEKAAGGGGKEATTTKQPPLTREQQLQQTLYPPLTADDREALKFAAGGGGVEKKQEKKEGGGAEKEEEAEAARAKGAEPASASSQAAEGKPEEEEELSDWTVLEKPSSLSQSLSSVQQRLADVWSTYEPALTAAGRKLAPRLKTAASQAKEQVQSMITHETTQSLLEDGSELTRRYVCSLQCMLGSFLSMPVDQQVPVVVAVVLYFLVPLLYLWTDEAQSVLAWTSVAYLVTHALMHFTTLPLSDCLMVGRLVHAPMLFALWMTTGTEAVIAAHPGWLQIVHARPSEMHLFLLWLRSTLMFSFALLCRDVSTLLHWKSSSDAAAAASVAAGGAISEQPSCDGELIHVYA